MSVLSIHRRPALVIERAKTVLESVIDIDEVHLGGGSALEALGKHRTITDLDFSASGKVIDTLFYERRPLEESLSYFYAKGIINGQAPFLNASSVLHFEIEGTPISLARTAEFHGRSEDSESLTGIKLASNEDVVTKKLYNRLYENGLTTERDAYDFIVARNLDPSTMRFAWGYLSPVEQEVVIEHVRDAIRHPESIGETSKRVTEPKYPHILRNLWIDLAEMFESDLAQYLSTEEGLGCE